MKDSYRDIIRVGPTIATRCGLTPLPTEDGDERVCITESWLVEHGTCVLREDKRGPVQMEGQT